MGKKNKKQIGKHYMKKRFGFLNPDNIRCVYRRWGKRKDKEMERGFKKKGKKKHEKCKSQ